MLLKQLLILGHPRCGSGFCSYYLNLLGLQIVHEKDPLHHDGISNWAFTIIHNKNDNIFPRIRVQICILRSGLMLRCLTDGIGQKYFYSKFTWTA